MNDPTPSIAARIKAERQARGWTLAELADRSGVSRAMISNVERGAASPTATLLGRLSGAFGLTLSTLLARAEGAGARLARAADQPQWRDPDSGYVRRAVSPPGELLELVDIELPSEATVSYPAAAYAFLHQQVWVRSGVLTLTEGGVEHRLEAGDCIQFGAPSDCTFSNRGPDPCCYLVAVVRRGG